MSLIGAIVMMDEAAEQRVDTFLKTWVGSQGNERANYQSFLQDWCGALGVAAVLPKGSGNDSYCFDKDVVFFHKDKAATTNFIDLWRSQSFVFEAKQGSDGSTKASTPKRGTAGYLKYMEKAFYQARSYIRQFEVRPPFILTCDIGSHFELWQDFSGQFAMGYGARERIELEDFRKKEVFDRFVLIFNDPQSLNPEKVRARVTREVAAELAELARGLEDPHPSPLPRGEGARESDLDPAPLSLGRGVGGEGRSANAVANFLMRCIFTMFAEDVGLLPGEVFTRSLKERWIPNPRQFKGEIEGLWETMNAGGKFGFERILRFNGGFFSDCSAFELTKGQLETLVRAADKDWSLVEPAIFGTLLERALDVRERSRLGAHYTPRSYVERLVKPVVMEPLRSQWAAVEMEVDRILQVEAGKVEPTVGQRKKAEGEIRSFLMTLQSVRILDPACGSGNFLYVTLDLLKTLEMEVLQRWVDVTGSVQLSVLEQVKPSQFLGIEVNPRAAAIAELVIWIGYLQWHFKRFGNAEPPEPVLVAYGNIECRDAVLEWDRTELDVTQDGKVRSRWGGRLMRHPVTGEEVPDPADQVEILRYVNPRAAVWPEADYIVSNPPFIGNYRMREMLGDGYAEALRTIYKQVSDTADYVMYWWHQSADKVRNNAVKGFGLITTNSIWRVFQRKTVDYHLSAKNPLRLSFAIADHPWADYGAAVRIAMTAGDMTSDTKSIKSAQLGKLITEGEGITPEESADQITIEYENVGKILSNLRSGVDVTQSKPLKSNEKLCCRGVQLIGRGFELEKDEINMVEKEVLHPHLNGRDLMQKSRNNFVIDLFGLTEDEVRKNHPQAYQHVYERVKPEREQNNRESYRKNWWIFGEARSSLRSALKDLTYYVTTVETSKHRAFFLLETSVIPDNSLVSIAVSDIYFLGVLSSKLHCIWALSTGGTLEDRPVYTKTYCFDRFPFPDPTDAQKQKIRELGDRLDSHRKTVQANHPDITITGMYNLLEKLRKGEPFTDNDRDYNNKALVSTLKQIHDDLDRSVLEAYGWEDLIGGVSGNQPSSPALLPRGEGSQKEEEENPLISQNTPTPTPTPIPTPTHVPLLPGEKGLGDEGFSEIAGKARQIPKVLLERARELRQTQTPAEQILWECLRDRKLCDTKFRRQHNIGPFIADFYSHRGKLVIELDGSIHDTQIERDRNRDEWMQDRKLTVVRFTNEQIFNDLETVLIAIAEQISSPSPIQPSSPALLPSGEGSQKEGSQKEQEGNPLISQNTPTSIPTPTHVPLLPGEKGLGDEGKSQNADEIILERLVKLNADRAAEERNGFIRWLRPEYQAPDTIVHAPALPGLLTEEPTIVLPTEQKTWSKNPKDQLTALQDLFRTHPTEWTLAQIAAQFKNGTRNQKSIRDNLDRLEFFGIILHYQTDGLDRWSIALQ